MPFAPDPSSFRTDTLKPFDPATDTPATDFTPPPAPPVAETLLSGFRLHNPIASYVASSAPVFFVDDWDKSYDVFNDMHGYEDYAYQLAGARNAVHAQQIKDDINQENIARRTLGSSGPLGTAAGIAAGGLSPEQWLPIGEVYTGLKAGYNILRIGANAAKMGAISAGIQEAELQATQQTRTVEESAINIGAATFLSGVMGAGAAKLVGREGVAGLAAKAQPDLIVHEKPDMVDDVADTIDALKQAHGPVPEQSTTGAMQTPRETIEQNTLKSSLGAGWLTDKLNISPAVRLLNSPSLATREVFQQLAETPLFLKKNAEGIASEQAVETYAKEYHSLLGQSAGVLDKQYAAYRQTTKGQPERLSFEQFKAEGAGAMRRGDAHPIPQVDAAAKAYRPLFERMKNEAIDAGLLPEDVEPRFATSYLSRQWDRNKIQMQEKEFRGTIRDWAQEKATKVMRAAMADYNRKINNHRAEAADLEMANLRADSQAAPATDAPKTDDALAMLHAMRSNPPPKRPQTLMDFLHSSGGIKDEEGLLKNAGISNKSRVGFVSKHGLSLDQAAEKAWKEGFFPGRKAPPDINHLLEALRDEHGGVSATVREKDIAALRDAENYDDMVKALQQLGIDTADLPGGRGIPKDLTPADLGSFREKINAVTKERRLKRIEILKAKIAEIEAERHLEMDTRFDVSNDMQGYLDDVVNKVFDTLTGRESVNLGEGFVVSTRGPLRSKSLDIQDTMVEQFLNNDIDMIARKHVKVIGTDVELKRKFGDVSMADQLANIRAEYDALREKMPEKAAELAKREQSDIGDLEMMRDLMRGTYDDGTSAGWKRAGRLARAWNFVTKMGMVVVSSFADVARPVMVHGINRSFGDLIIPMTKGLQGIKMQAAEGKLAGHIFDTVLSSRMMEMSDLADPYAKGTVFERFIHNNMVPSFSKLTMMNRWNDMMKTAASAMTQSRVLENAETLLTKGELAPAEKEYMAFLGIDKHMAKSIAQEFKEHGEIVDGVRIANTEAWGNREAVRTFRAALNKEVDSIIVQPGVADKPLFMNNEWGKTVLQFRTFFFASNQRVMMRGLQQRDAAVLNGTLMSVAIGMLTAHLKATARGDDTSQWSAAKWIAEGVDQSGITPVMMELNNTAEKIGLPGIYKAIGEEKSSRYGSRNVMSSFAGPTFGLGEDIVRLGYLATHPDELKKGDIKILRRLIPYQNLFFVRWAFNKLEGETADALGAQ